MKIIDDTYNGEKYPIIEREFNAYYFPDNYDPDNLEEFLDATLACNETSCKTKVYHHANPK
jgi:hypothetical protein